MVSFEEALQDGLRRLPDTADVFVLQIGAGDGIHGDFLHVWLQRSRWKALLLEPVSHVFDTLCQSYADQPDVHCEKVAISDRDVSRELFRIGDLHGLPWWADQLGSFDRTVILSHHSSIPDIDSRIVGEVVNCLTMRSLLEQYSIRHINLLAVDTEGFDADVIQQTLDHGVVPDLILFEHKHLTQDTIRSLHQRLESLEYQLTTGQYDTFSSRRHRSVSVSPF